MIDIDEFPDGSDRVLIALDELTVPEEASDGPFPDVPPDRLPKEREIASFLGEDKDWARYRLEQLVSGEVVGVRYWDQEHRNAPPVKLYELHVNGEEWVNAQTELEEILGDIPANVRVHHLREVAGKLHELKEEVRMLRAAVEG